MRTAMAPQTRRNNTHPVAWRLNALWGRGGRRANAVALPLALLAGLATSGVMDVPAAQSRAADCVTPVICPTITTPTLPTISLPLPTTTTTPPTTTSADPTQANTDATATTQSTGAPDGASAPPQAPSVAFTFAVVSSVHAHGHRRWVELRVSLSRPARVVATLFRGRVISARGRYAAAKGANRFRLSVPRRAPAGRNLLKVELAAGTTRR